ncbi:thiamine pyrophosphate-binding protein, partial [Clavibacter michiganensis]|uniref:thiamine pyrophosphate-binding protein n=1 Tax=Clavibacter michiganensis TaxID=28447 RepID=UPI001177D2C1
MSGALGHPDPAAGERAIPPDAATSDPWAVVARTLLEHGVRQVLGLPDDDMASLAAFRTAGIDFVWMSSQRTAVSAAAGQAIASRRPAVVVVGRGPGVAATVPSLLEALAAHAPVLVLASGTASARLRDRAFQDAPTLALAAPVTVWAERVETGAALPGAIAEALARAGAVPGGPVLLEIPDGLTVEGEVRRPSTRMELPELLSAFLAAERPVILVGGGARGAVPPAALHELADRAGAGVAVTASVN